MENKILYSAVQPSGNLTIGNYAGAIRNWLALQNEYECFFAVADMHAVTVRQEPALLRRRTLELVSLYLACGIDPQKCTLYVQSQVPQHAELTWVLNSIAYVGEMERMTQFKDKSRKHADNINMGLMDYPVLMAADILLYDTDLVPVGYDQLQHIEITRDLALRINNIYGDIFKVPDGFIPKVGAKIMSLQDPTSKMSKSDTNPNAVISCLDTPDVIMKKFKRAVTDSDTTIAYDPQNKAGISNLLGILAVAQGKTIEETLKDCEGFRYGDLKVRVGESVIEMLRPFQEEYNRLIEAKDYLTACAKDGAEKAREIAENTLKRFKKALGYIL